MTNLVVDVKNYQIIREASVEFNAGLNVVIGDSNNGKTALFRAIETALFNLPREGHITAGESASSVTIAYNGHKVAWERDSKKASPVSYTIDSKKITKVGRGQPEEVGQVFGIREVELDTDKIRLNFQKQMAFPFLLDKTASQMFKFIIQGTEQDNLMLVLEDMKKDLTQNRVDLTSAEAARDAIGLARKQEQDKYDLLEPFLPIATTVLAMDGAVNAVHVLEELVLQMHQCEESKAQLDKVYEKLSVEYSGLCGSLSNIPEKLQTVTELEHLVCNAQVCENELQTSERTQKRLAVVLTECQATGVDSIPNLIESVQELERLVRDIQACEAELQATKCSKERLGGMLDKYQVTGVDTVPELIKGVLELEKLIQDMAGIMTTGNNFNKRHQELTDMIAQVDSELKTFNVCPYCGNSLKNIV